MSEADQREEAVFEAALQLEGAARRAYLAQACAGDVALRERLEGLLGALERAGSRLAEPAVLRDKALPLPSAPPGARPGDRIGRYRLLQQIGEGGGGVVYMAEQEEPVRRRVALKVIKLGMDTRQVVARFEAERQALALMDHPNIAKVHDAGATDTGRPYFVMELVRGTKITDYCDEKNLSTQQRLQLFIQVCQAIQHAHQKGIIHRDIKPSNILVTVNDGVPVPKVIDFGIAKATAGQSLTDKTLFTAFEQFIGTPAYMSPEQAELTSVDIDTRSDLYSLGVLLYELLTGKTPFDSKELLQAGLDEMRRTIREKEPARPSTCLSTMAQAELTTAAKRRHTEAPKLIHAVRGDLDWIVMKCLEKDRARRYETANGLVRDIERHLTNEPVTARPPSRWYTFQRTVRRHRFGFAAGAALALVVALGAITSAWQAVRATREQRIAERERDRAIQADAAAEEQKLAALAEARNAATQLADSLINQGDALTTAAEFPPAYARYAEAASLLERLGNPLARLDLSLVRLYRASPPPLWSTKLAGFAAGIVALPSRKEVILLCGSQFHALDQVSGALVRSFGSERGARSLALADSPEGPMLVVCGANFVRLINPTNGVLIRQVTDDRAAKFCVISPDGSMAASADDSGNLMLWETSTFKEVSRGAQRPRVHHATFSHNGTMLATAGDYPALWNVETGQELWHLPGPNCTRVAFSADDKALACGEPGGFISLVSLAGNLLARWQACRAYDGVESLMATPEGNRLITASSDGEVRIFDNSFDRGWTWTLTMGTNNPMKGTVYIGDAGRRFCAATSGLPAADQGVVIGCTSHGQVFAWPLRAPDRFKDRLEGAISISQDGLLYSGRIPGRVEVRDLATDRTFYRLPQLESCRATAFSRDNRLLYLGTHDGVLRAFDLQRGEYLWATRAHDQPVSSIDVAPDDAMVASAAEDGTIRVWEARTGGLLGSLHHQGGYGTAAIFVPDADPNGAAGVSGGTGPRPRRILVGGGDSGVIHDCDPLSGTEARRAYAPGPIRGLALSPDHKLLAVASVAHRAALFNSATLEQVGILGPVPSSVYKVCFIDPGAGAGTWALASCRPELRAFDMSTRRESVPLSSTFGDRAGTAMEANADVYGINTLAASADGAAAMATGTGRISFTLPRRYRELLRAPSALRQADVFAEWGVWAWVRELLERERTAGRECPAALIARAYWMCGDYDSARMAFDQAVQRQEVPAWYAVMCQSVQDSPPIISPLQPVARPNDPLEQPLDSEPLPEGVMAAGEVQALNSQMGREVDVEGVVIDSAWSRSGNVMNIVFASVDKDNPGLLACVFLSARAAFDGAFAGDAAGTFAGARLRLHGTLGRYGGYVDTMKGLPTIVLADPQQVSIVQSRPARGKLPVPFSATNQPRR